MILYRLVTVNWSIQMCEICKLLHVSAKAVNLLCNNANLCRGVEMFQDIPRKDSVCSFCLLHFLNPDDECTMHSPGHRVRCYSPSLLPYNASISIRQRCELLFHETIQEESSLISFHILLQTHCDNDSSHILTITLLSRRQSILVSHKDRQRWWLDWYHSTFLDH